MRDTTPADVETRVSVQVLLGFFAGVDGCVDVDLQPCSRSHNLLRKVKPQFLRWSFGAPSIHREPAGDIPSTFLPTFFGFLLLGSCWSKDMKCSAARALYSDLKISA